MSEQFIIFDTGPDGDLAGFANPSQMIVAWDMDDVGDAFAALETARAAGKWLAGYMSYELGYVFEPRLHARMPANRDCPLICFGVFDGVDMAATRGLMHTARADAADADLDPPAPDWAAHDYADAFAHVADYIRAGDFYQTNLTFGMNSAYRGTPLGLYAALRHGQPVNYGALVHLGVGPHLVSRSPELFFNVDGDGMISTRPMKGTVPRGKTPGEDADLKNFLASDVKNRAENLMIVDLLRNDISRVAKLGSVRVPELFSVETYATVHQMTSLVQADLIDDLSIETLMRALFPCGSITGAPKLRAMEVINDLEPRARDAYCGSIGWIAPDGRMAFNVAIRTLALNDDRSVRLNVGGGVVYDSTAYAEYEEALWKARYTNIVRPS